MKPGETVSAPDIVLAPADRVITGQVTDAEGKPVESARVSASGRSTNYTDAISDVEGRFTLKEIVLENVTLNVSAQGFAPFQTQHLAGGFNDVRLVLNK